MTCVIEGEANGADLLGRRAAEELGLPLIPVKAEWDKFGKSAGPIRNRKMLTLEIGKPELVLAFHDDIENSKGTKDMVQLAQLKGIEYRIIFHERK